MPQTHLPEKWIERVCDLLEIPQNHQTLRFFTAWQRAEGGEARWNPLNTTLRLSGTVDWTDPTDYNNIGVRNFEYAIAGVCATALTFQQRTNKGLLFGGLLTSLRQAKTADKTAEQLVTENESQIRLWGTDATLMLEVLKSIE